mgnify:CR=1 FL=1
MKYRCKCGWSAKQVMIDDEILNALKRENLQRDTIFNGLNDADKNDWIIISDLDEIPNPRSLYLFNPKNKFAFYKKLLYSEDYYPKK